MNILITDLFGVEIKSTNSISKIGNNNIPIDITGLTNGNYILSIKSNGFNYKQKFNFLK